MAYRFTSDGFGADASVISADGAHPDYVRVPDAALLFTGDFRRAGPDLVLTGADGRHHVVPGYFAGAHRPALVAPNGASLSPDVVELLAGSPTPGEYAQAQPTAPPAPIGKVEKVVGSATAMRNGVAVVLHVGDPIYKSDVIQTGAGSSVGISFPDGTALNLIANTRMALTDFSYDPNGHSNTALLNLVEGTFAFVAGKVAHTGDMKIETPVATMGIRGTTGYVQEVANITATLGSITYSFAVVGDYGTNRVGEYELIDANGDVIATVSQSGYVTYVTPQGPGQPPLVTTEPMTNSQLGFEQQIIQQVFQVLNSNVNPQAPGTPGSSTQPPGPVPPFPQLLHDNGGQQLNFNIQGPAGGGTVAINGGQYTVSGTDTWSATASGLWITALDWNQGAPPIPQQVVVIPDYKVSLSTSVSTSGLEVYSGATFNIVDGGSFTVTGTIGNSGIIQINSSGADPTLALNGSVLLLGGGKIEMIGPTPDNLIVAASPGATLTNVDNTISGSGTIGRGDGALTLVNGVAGTIEATPYEVVYSGQSVTNTGVLILDTGNPISNSGLLEATLGGTLVIDDALDNSGTVKADGTGAMPSTVALLGTVTNESTGLIEATDGGHLDVQTNSITNNGSNPLDSSNPTGILLEGTLLVDSHGGKLTLTGGGDVALQGGAIDGNGGAETLDNSNNTIFGYGSIGTGIDDLALSNEGTIDANDASGRELSINGVAVTNTSELEATDGGVLVLSDLTVANFTGSGISLVNGTVYADATSTLTLENAKIHGGTVTIDGTLNSIGGSSYIDNGAVVTDTDGTIEASAGTLFLDVAISNTGTLEAVSGGTLQLDANVDNSDHQITVGGDSFLKLNGITITGGTIDDYDGAGGGTIDVTGTGLSEIAGTSSAEAALTGNASGSVVTLDAGLTLDDVALSGISIRAGTSTALTAAGTVEIAGATTFEGLTVSNSGAIIQIDGGETLTLDQGGSIASGALVFGDDSDTLLIGSGGAALDGVAVSGGGAIDVGNATITGTTLTLAGTDSITGGTIDDGTAQSGGTIDITGTTTISDATLNYGTVNVESGALLIKNNVTINGTVINDPAGAMQVNSTLTLEGGASINDFTVDNFGSIVAAAAATFSGDTIDNESAGDTLQIDGAATLTLSGTTINRGTVNDYSVISGNVTAGTIDVTSNSTINGASLNNGRVTVRTDVTLTLDNVTATGTTFNNAAASSVLSVDGGDTLTLSGATVNDGTIDAHSTFFFFFGNGSEVKLDGATLDGTTLETGSLSSIQTVGSGSISTFEGVTNDAAVQVNGGTTLNLVGTIANRSGTITVANGGTLTLSGAALSGGSLNNSGAIEALSGNGSSSISGYDDLSIGSGITVDSGATLVLADDMLSDGTIAVLGLGMLILSGSTLSGDQHGPLTLSNSGSVEIYGNSALENVDFTNAISSDTIAVGAQTLTLENGTIITGGAITIGGSGVLDIESNQGATLDGVAVSGGGTVRVDFNFNPSTTLTLDDGTIITGGALAIGSGSELDIERGAHGPGATLDDVIVTNSGTIEVDTSNSSTTTLILDGGTVVTSGTLSIGNSGVLDIETVTGLGATLDGVTVANSGIIEIGSASAATLTLDGGTTVTGGAMLIGGSGVLDIESPAGATLDGVTVTVMNGGAIEVDLTTVATLTLDGGTTVTGGALRIGGSGTLDILSNAGATLDSVNVNNANAIDVGSHFSGAELAIGGTVTLDGTGALVLENGGDQIVGPSHGGGTLDNDSTLAGVGTIGDHLTLDNQSQGTIDADVTDGTLTIDTAITNQGTLEATNGGTLDIQDAVTDSGAGHALVEGGTLTLAASASTGGPNEGVVFNNGTGVGAGTDYGQLILDDWQQFTGDISGFAGTQGNANHSDEIVLANFDPKQLEDTASYNSTTNITTLTIFDGKNHSLTDTLSFVGDYTDHNTTNDFFVKEVGSNVEIFDPPAGNSSSQSVAIGGPGNDHFLFHPDIGADTAGGFEPQHHAGAYDHFADAPTMQELASLVAADAHGDAFIHFGHDDGVAIPGVTASYLQAHLHSLAHLHG